MDDIDRASIAQKWLMKYYGQWIPLDSCLELIRAIDAGATIIERDEQGDN